MKTNVLIFLSMLILLVSCKSVEPEANYIIPMDLDEERIEIFKLMDINNSASIYSGNVDDSFSSCRFYVEVFEDGKVIEVQNGPILNLDEDFEFSVIRSEMGTWAIKFTIKNGYAVSNIKLDDLNGLSNELLRATSRLNYKVDINDNEPQILEVVYFDENSTVGIESGMYERNEIHAFEEVDFLHVLWVVFD